MEKSFWLSEKNTLSKSTHISNIVKMIAICNFLTNEHMKHKSNYSIYLVSSTVVFRFKHVQFKEVFSI